MRKLPLFVLALVAVSCLSCYAGQNEEFSGPNVWDFGKIASGSKVEHTFIFKNQGIEKLTIKDVTTSCGCTASKSEKQELGPGEETPINVTFNSSGYGGPVRQFVYIHTDSKTDPLIKYIVRADVELPK